MYRLQCIGKPSSLMSTLVYCTAIVVERSWPLGRECLPFEARKLSFRGETHVGESSVVAREPARDTRQVPGGDGSGAASESGVSVRFARARRGATRQRRGLVPGG